MHPRPQPSNTATTAIYLSLLAEFPELTQVCSPDTPIRHDITHQIMRSGPARPRRLAPERLRVAKQEFEHMLQLAPHLVHGHPRCTWCQRRHLATGAPVETTVHSTALLSQTATPYRTSKTSLRPSKAPASFLNWI